MTQTTQTTGDQKTTRAWLNKYGQYNLHRCVFALLKYLANNCYWQQAGKNYKIRRDFPVSLSTLSKNMGCTSSNTVQKYIDEAVALGFITVVKGENQKNAYALHIEKANAEYKPSKDVKQEQQRKKREVKTAWMKKRREELAKLATEADPYEDLVTYAMIDRSTEVKAGQHKVTT
jgi:hypothetical protein